MKTIVLDPGHGKRDPGRIAIDGLPEKVFNWQVCEALGTYLRERYLVKVIYTHEGPETSLSPTGDLADELRRRANKANGARADLLVSIHHDGFGNPEARGGSLWIWTKLLTPEGELRWLPAMGNHTDPKTHPIAAQMVGPIRDLLAAYGIPWRSLGDPDGVSCANFGVLSATSGPALLLECMFGTSPADVAAARKPEFIPDLARTIAEAIAKALGLEAKESIPAIPAGAILVNGVPLQLDARNEQGHTVGRLRAMAEALGGKVRWDAERRVMTVEN